MNNNKKAGIIALGLISAGVYLSLSYPFFRFITYGGNKAKKSESKKWFSLKHTTINHPKHGYEEEYLATRKWCEEQPMEDIYIESYDGIKLHAKYFPAEDPERFVLLAHGYRGTAFGSVAHMAEFMHENNCSLLFNDQRCCGESEGQYITFGAKEQHDILSWLNVIGKLNNDKNPVYLYGQSMGAASVILAAGHQLPEEVKGVISDCGFHSMKQQMRDMAAEWFHIHLVELFLFRVDILCRIFAGFSMKEADTTTALKKNERPMLFIHGDKDTYVYPHNSIINYEMCRAPKELVVIPGARHLCSSYVEPELYKKKLTQFFRKYD